MRTTFFTITLLAEFAVRLAFSAEGTPPMRSDISQAAAHATGIAAFASELSGDPKIPAARAYALVSESSHEVANELGSRPMAYPNNSGFEEWPTRVRFKLTWSGFGNKPKSDETEYSWIEWHKAAKGITGYYEPKWMVAFEPFKTGNLISFVYDEHETDRKQFRGLIVLSHDHERQWMEAQTARLEQQDMFNAQKIDQKQTDLKIELRGKNLFSRLAVLAHLAKCQRLADDDVKSVMEASCSYIEIASVVLLILEHAPERSTALLQYLQNLEKQRVFLDGVTLGASIHFLGLDPKLESMAGHYQQVLISTLMPKQPSGYAMPKELVETHSYPLLFQIGKVVLPEEKSLVKADTLLWKLLFITHGIWPYRP